MGARARRLTTHLRGHDAQLFARSEMDGSIRVYRHGTRYEKFDFNGDTFIVSRPDSFLVLALTHNWSIAGEPVDWGIDPLLSKIKESDFHRTGELLADQLRKERERDQALTDRANRNEIKARAYDMRRDFARATNEINTSGLKKTESRRIKDGYIKP